jgi:hypothetical protein
LLATAFVGMLALAGCATTAPLASVGNSYASAGQSPTSAVAAAAACPSAGRGSLIVYSATYPQTLEQSEYPAHTNYTIATAGDQVLKHVANNTGSFGAYPATVELACGAYHVRAQYAHGGFVVVPITIQADKTTVVDLDVSGELLPPFAGEAKEPIRLPDGEVVGWRAVSG